MPNLTVQPSTTRPVPRGEALTYCIIATEFIGAGGVRAEAYIDFNGTTYTPGDSFVFAGVTFTLSASTISHNRFPIVVDAEESANNFREALEMNANFFGLVDIFVENPAFGEWRTRVRWKDAGPVSPWAFDYSGLSPEPAHGETPGEVVDVTPGMRLRYQLFARRDGEVFAVTDIEAITPRATWFSTPRSCFDFRDDVKGLVSVTFPGPDLDDIVADGLFSISLFLKYGVFQVNDCEVTEFNWLSSDEATLLNSVVQIDDVEKLKPYNYGDTNPVGLLTSRPQSVPVPPGAYLWAWVYCTHLAGLANLERYRVNWKYYDSAGVLLLEETSATEPAEDGVYVFPTGPGNSPNVPAGTAKIVVRLEVYHNVFEQFVDASAAHTVLVGTDCNGQEEFYFVEDLGGYGTIHFDEVEEITHVVENQVFASPEKFEDDLYNADLSNRLLNGGYSRANIRSWRTFRATVRGMDTPELERWFRQFCDSENVLWMYVSDTGDEVIRKVILEPGETVIRRDGEYLTLEVVFRHHTNMR